jgi:hypothetical protein
MIVVYRKRKDSLESEWHFHTQCPHWPETNFIQARFLEPSNSNHICAHCIELDSKMFPSEKSCSKE